MADLDTRDKRGSAIMLDQGWGRVFPNPSGAISTDILRVHAGSKYALAAGSSPPPPIVGNNSLLTLLLSRGMHH